MIPMLIFAQSHENIFWNTTWLEVVLESTFNVQNIRNN